MKSNSLVKLEIKIDHLASKISDFEHLLLEPNPNTFIIENANFLTRSFLISLCGYLEVYLKDIIEEYLVKVNDLVSSIKVPINLIRWSIENKPKANSKMNSLLDPKKTKFEDLQLRITKNDLDQFISGNPFRTKDLLIMFGIDLESYDFFSNMKVQINSFVFTRNNILHYDDDASSLTTGDIMEASSLFLNYALQIDDLITNKINQV